MGYIHEAWLKNRFEHADTLTPSQNPYSFAWCAKQDLDYVTVLISQ